MEKARQETIHAYRNVFSSPDGKRVLGHLLLELGFFNEKNIPEYDDFAKRLLQNCGIWQSDNAKSIVEQLLRADLIKD